MAALLAAAPALLAPAGAPALQGAEPVARALAGAPLYVDPSLAGSLRPAQRGAVLRALAAAPRPAYLVIAPLVPGDAFNGSPSMFLAALHDRLGRDGIYAVISDRSLSARDFGHDDTLALRAELVTSAEAGYDEPASTTALRFLGALRDPGLARRYRRDEGPSASPPAAGGGSDHGGGDAGGTVVAGALAAGALAGGAGLWWRRRRARPAPETAPELPRGVFERAREAADEGARASAEREAMALASAVEATPVPTRPEAEEAYGRALDAGRSARLVLDRARGTADLVGALVLAQDGRWWLSCAQALQAGRAAPQRRRRCALDPRHAAAFGEATWGSLRLPACRRCMHSLDAGRAPDVLMDEGRPYLERDSVWSRTAFGALADDLLERVAGGER